jgi:hypothetical protein
MSNIATAFDAKEELRDGVGVLSQDEWLNLSAFTDTAIYFNPSTEKLLRAAIDLKPAEKLVPEFEVTIQKYARLKGYCQVFEDEINPGTRELAQSVVQYARSVPSVYDALAAAIKASQNNAIDITLERALTELSKHWQSLHPSKEAEVARGKFVQYIGVLKQDAQERAAEATTLHKKLMTFHGNLKSSNAEFVADAKNYEKLFGSLNPRVQFLKTELDILQKELNGMRKQEADFVIVLETAPLYLLIPFFGPWIMSGVLVGVGGALGALRKKIWDKLEEAIRLNDELGPKEKFMAYYKYGQDSTGSTAKEVEKAAKLVEKLKNAWGKITSDLGDLNKRLLDDASKRSLTGDWDVAMIKLDTAKATWRDLKVDAERYLTHQLGRAEDLDQAMGGLVATAVA